MSHRKSDLGIPTTSKSAKVVLVPDHKTIANFRKDNGGAIRKVCARFLALCRTMGLLTQASCRDRRQQVQGGDRASSDRHT
jgi:hypothetical protein